MQSSLLRYAGALFFCGAMLAPVAAQTHNFPTRPVTVVVPFPPGGSMDALGRATAEKLAQKWGQPVLVDNRAGAGGLIGAQHVKDASADGYTLLLTNSALVQAAVSPIVKAPYDPIKDFAPVMHMTMAPVVFSINPKIEAKTLGEFVELVKREKGKHSFGSGGVNQTLHLQGALLNNAAGLDMAHVAYKGDAAIVTAIMAGHISSGMATIATAKPQIEAGNIRALAVVGPESPLLPGVPSFVDLGFPELGVVGWFGMFAPAGTPKEIIDKIAADIEDVLKMPDVAQGLTSRSLTPTGIGPEEYAKIVKRDLGYWDEVMKKVGEK